MCRARSGYHTLFIKKKVLVRRRFVSRKVPPNCNCATRESPRARGSSCSKSRPLDFCRQHEPQRFLVSGRIFQHEAFFVQTAGPMSHFLFRNSPSGPGPPHRDPGPEGELRKLKCKTLITSDLPAWKAGPFLRKICNFAVCNCAVRNCTLRSVEVRSAWSCAHASFSRGRSCHIRTSGAQTGSSAGAVLRSRKKHCISRSSGFIYISLKFQFSKNSPCNYELQKNLKFCEF